MQTGPFSPTGPFPPGDIHPALGQARASGRHARPPARRVPAKARRGRVAIAAVAGVLLAAFPLAVSTSASTVPPAAAGWSTVFSDSFTGAAGSAPGPAWTSDTGTQYNGAGCPGGWGTGEVETSTGSAANVSDDGSGHLAITPVNSGGVWTSGRIETAADNFAAPAGGELEVSASIQQPGPAAGLGYWPAFWMLGAGFRASGAGTSGTMNCPSWPSVGEIDVMEDVNGLSEVSGTLHCGTSPGGPCAENTGLTSGLQPCPGCQAGFSTYSVIVNRTSPGNESITWLRDGNAYHTVTENQVGAAAWQAAVDHGFFLLLDVAVGGGFPDGVCGCSSPPASTTSGAAMRVGYVAVYQRAGGSGASPAASPVVAAVSGGPGSPAPVPAPSAPASTDPAAPATPSQPAAAPGANRAQCTTTATADISADCLSVPAAGLPSGATTSSLLVTAAAGDTSPAAVDSSQLAQLASGEVLEYPGINFGSGSSQFAARVASGAGPGVSGLVEVVLDNPASPPVSSFAVSSTGGWDSWRTIPANMATVTGTHTVYLEFLSSAPGDPPYVSLHYFTFPVS